MLFRSGIQPNTAAQRDEWMDLGYRVISWNTDITVYREALTAGIKGVRDHALTGLTEPRP